MRTALSSSVRRWQRIGTGSDRSIIDTSRNLIDCHQYISSQSKKPAPFVVVISLPSLNSIKMYQTGPGANLNWLDLHLSSEAERIANTAAPGTSISSQLTPCSAKFWPRKQTLHVECATSLKPPPLFPRNHGMHNGKPPEKIGKNVISKFPSATGTS